MRNFGLLGAKEKREERIEEWKRTFTRRSGIKINKMTVFHSPYVLLELFNVSKKENPSVRRKIKGMTFKSLYEQSFRAGNKRAREDDNDAGAAADVADDDAADYTAASLLVQMAADPRS